MGLGRMFDLMNKHFSSIGEIAKVRYMIPKRQVTTRRDRCVGCGACARRFVCPVRAVSLKDSKVSIDHGRCLTCGHCILACRRGALAMSLTRRRV